MGKKTTKKTARTINQKGATKPAAFKKESTPTNKKQTEKNDDEGWGSIGTVAKKAAKGAVKGAAKDVLK